MIGGDLLEARALERQVLARLLDLGEHVPVVLLGVLAALLAAAGPVGRAGILGK